MKLLVRYLNKKMPELVTDLENSGADVRANIEQPLTVDNGRVANIPLGISAELVDYPCIGLSHDGEYAISYELQIRPRSGHTSKGIITQLGTVDAGYRGEIYANVLNTSGKEITIEPMERIGQLVVCPIYKPIIIQVDRLSETKRGVKGFGSSGKF